MLIAAKRSIGLWFWRGHPIPTAISMFSQTPDVVKCGNWQLSLRSIVVFLSLFTTSKHHHHPEGRSLLANGSWVINSRTGHYLILKLIFLPRERTLENVEKPNIVLCLIAWVTSEDDKIRLIKEHGVAVSLPRGNILAGNLNNLPNRSTWKESLLFS